jgi:hypothetical protein
VTQSATTLTRLGITFVRTTGYVQTGRISSGTNRTLQSICDELNADLRGASASVYRNSYIRIRTNTFAESGDILVAVADAGADILGFSVGTLVANATRHVSSVETAQSELGTPLFNIGTP